LEVPQNSYFLISNANVLKANGSHMVKIVKRQVAYQSGWD
jgi:hypothetical protein